MSYDPNDPKRVNPVNRDPAAPKETYVEPVERRSSPLPLIIGVLVALALAYFVLQRFMADDTVAVEGDTTTVTTTEDAPAGAVTDEAVEVEEVETDTAAEAAADNAAADAEASAETAAEAADEAADNTGAAADSAAENAEAAADDAANSAAEATDAAGTAIGEAADSATDAAGEAADAASEAADDAADALDEAVTVDEPATTGTAPAN